MIAGSTHRGENSPVYKAFVKIRDHFPEAKLIIAPRYIYQADLIVDEGIKHGVTMVKRSDMMAGKAIRSAYDGVILDTIGELGRVYSLGDLIFVGGTWLISAAITSSNRQLTGNRSSSARICLTLSKFSNSSVATAPALW